MSPAAELEYFADQPVAGPEVTSAPAALIGALSTILRVVPVVVIEAPPPSTCGVATGHWTVTVGTVAVVCAKLALTTVAEAVPLGPAGPVGVGGDGTAGERGGETFESVADEIGV